MAESSQKSSPTQDHTYVIDRDYRVVYLDQATQRMFPGGRIGEPCYKCLRGQTEPCNDCPWHPESHERATQNVIYNACTGQYCEVTCLELDWLNEKPCVLFSNHPIDEEVRQQPTQAECAHIQRLRERNRLTGLYNAFTFYDKAEQLIAETPDISYEAVYIDIAHFKIYNEWHGREAGNVILCAIAARAEDIAQRCGGIAGHLGGDDFTLVLPRGTVTEEAVARELKKPPFNSEDMIGFQPAFGVCDIDSPNIPVVTACDHAMIAMNTTKESYATSTAWYEAEMTEEMEIEAKILLEVKRALANREFVLYFQPQCSTRTGRIAGLEALVRWQHPSRGLVMPGAFVPVLERNNFIASLDLYVWEETCRYLRAWIDRGERPLPISVNISRADLYAIDVVDVLEDLVTRYKLDHRLLELEITESAYAEDEKMANTVASLKNLGFTILMDDFGSGYSSLNMLKGITVDILKIDMGFLARRSELQRSESILEAIVSMARFMDLRVIAEGAETKEQVDFLQDIGCEYAQGYYFYRPMPAEALEQLLAQEDIADYRGVLSPKMELINVNTLLHDDMTSRTTVDNLIGGLAVYAVYADHFELLQVNNEYYHVTGCNPIDLRERKEFISQQVHPDDLPLVQNMFDEAYRHPVVGAEATFRRYQLSGEIIWLRVRAYFLRREQDRVIMFASLSNVTEQKEQEEALRASQDALNDVLNIPASSDKAFGTLTSENRKLATQIFMQNAPGGLIGGYCEEGFPILFANEEIAHIAGYESSAELIEALDGLVSNSIHPDDLDQMIADIGPEHREGLEYHTQYRMRRKDGTYFWVADHGRIVRTGEGRLAIASLRIDIDNAVRAQLDLALEDDILHRIIKQSDLSVWVYDIDSDRLTFQNLSSKDRASLLAASANEENSDDLDNDMSSILRRLSHEALWGRPAARTVEAWSSTQDPITLHVEREIVPDANGKPARMIGYLGNPAKTTGA